MAVFETFLEQDGPQDAKTRDDGEKFRMSERQRVRGTAVASYFCESRGNLVSNKVMPPIIQKLLTFESTFRVFRVFRGSLSKNPCHPSCFSLSKLINVKKAQDNSALRLKTINYDIPPLTIPAPERRKSKTPLAPCGPEQSLGDENRRQCLEESNKKSAPRECLGSNNVRFPV